MNDKDVMAKMLALRKLILFRIFNPRAKYFDPAEVLDLFVRFEPLRDYLRGKHPQLFHDLPARPIPESSKTTDFEGRGHIKRRALQLLSEDLGYCIDVLEPKINAQSSPILEVGAGTKAAVKISEYSPIRVFISHASKDAELVNCFVERILRLGMNIPPEAIFCTSIDGMDIRSGDDFRDAIRNSLQSSEVVFLIITPNYKGSEVCLNEMGAAWVLGKLVIPLIVEPVTFDSVGVIMEPSQIARITEAQKLNSIRDQVLEKLCIPPIKTAIWEGSRTAFLQEAGALIKQIGNEKVLNRQQVEDLVVKNAELESQLGEVTKEYASIKQAFEELEAKLILS